MPLSTLVLALAPCCLPQAAPLQVVTILDAQFIDTVEPRRPLSQPLNYWGEGICWVDFKFTPPTGMPLPRRLDARWRILDPSGNAIVAGKHRDSAGALHRMEWNGDYDPEDWRCDSFAYDAATNEVSARLVFPILRGESGLTYPPMPGGSGSVEFIVGYPGSLSVDHVTSVVTGAHFEGSVLIPSVSRPLLMVDVPRRESAVNEIITVTASRVSSGTSDGPYAVSFVGPLDLVSDFPAVVSFAPGEADLQFRALVNGDGNGYFKLELASNSAISSRSVHLTMGGSNAALPVRDSGTASAGATGSSFLPSFSSLPIGSAGPLANSLVGAPDCLVEGSEGEAREVYKPKREPVFLYQTKLTDWQCVEGREFTRNKWTKCSDCNLAPTDPNVTIDCPNIAGPYSHPYCKKFCTFVVTSQYLPDDGIQCTIIPLSDPKNLTLYEWTGSEGEKTCVSAELSVGEIVAVTLGAEFVKDCCTYKKKQESGAVLVDKCVVESVPY